MGPATKCYSAQWFCFVFWPISCSPFHILSPVSYFLPWMSLGSLWQMSIIHWTVLGPLLLFSTLNNFLYFFNSSKHAYTSFLCLGSTVLRSGIDLGWPLHVCFVTELKFFSPPEQYAAHFYFYFSYPQWTLNHLRENYIEWCCGEAMWQAWGYLTVHWS